MTQVRVSKYNLEWPKIFIDEYERLRGDFADNCIDVHHIGSTAIEGLSAKPIIDIVLIVYDIYKVDEYEIPQYKARGELGIPFRRYFSSGDKHLHVFERDHPEIEKHLLFRDYLRTHETERDEYSDFKEKLAFLTKDRRDYTLGKNSFISNIIHKTGFIGLWIVHALHDVEIAKCQQLNDNSAYKFVLYKGANIVGIAGVSDDLKIGRVTCDNEWYEHYMISTLMRWIQPINNKARTIM